MDIHIGEVSSTVRATDSEALLSPAVLQQIVQAVLRELRAQEGYEERRHAERKLSRSVAMQRHSWE